MKYLAAIIVSLIYLGSLVASKQVATPFGVVPEQCVIRHAKAGVVIKEGFNSAGVKGVHAFYDDGEVKFFPELPECIESAKQIKAKNDLKKQGKLDVGSFPSGLKEIKIKKKKIKKKKKKCNLRSEKPKSKKKKKKK